MNRHRVLVVEDDREIREALVDLLNENCFEATGTVNGADALRHLSSSQDLPCLILLDLMMPVMDGPSFREAQLADPRIAHIPVVVVSAYRDVQSKAQKLKAASFLKKPPSLKELVTVVSQHC